MDTGRGARRFYEAERHRIVSFFDDHLGDQHGSSANDDDLQYSGRAWLEGLIETPARVVRALEEFFCGYREDPAGILQRSFEQVDGYDEMP